jgi:hypothetical protein
LSLRGHLFGSFWVDRARVRNAAESSLDRERLSGPALPPFLASDAD